MAGMTEQQAFRAMHLLVELLADQMGYENPKITVSVKNEGGREGEEVN